MVVRNGRTEKIKVQRTQNNYPPLHGFGNPVGFAELARRAPSTVNDLLGPFPNSTGSIKIGCIDLCVDAMYNIQ